MLDHSAGGTLGVVLGRPAGRFYYLRDGVGVLSVFHDERATLDPNDSFGSIFADYKILTDSSLTFRSNLGVDLSLSHNKAFARNFGDDNGATTTHQPGHRWACTSGRLWVYLSLYDRHLRWLAAARRAAGGRGRL